MIQAGKHMYLVGNWKSNKTAADAAAFIDELQLPELAAATEVIICPPYPYLPALQTKIAEKGVPIILGAQDLSPFPMGAYTGEIAGTMIKDTCKYVILGHSERRKYFGETNELVARKVQSALESNLTPIVCIDEPYLETQLNYFTASELKHIIVAYEPLAAIGSGTPDTPEHAAAVAKKIHQAAETDLPVLYGGSVTADSVSLYVSQPEISGVLVGGASLSPSSWAQIVTAAR